MPAGSHPSFLSVKALLPGFFGKRRIALLKRQRLRVRGVLLGSKEFVSVVGYPESEARIGPPARLWPRRVSASSTRLPPSRPFPGLAMSGDARRCTRRAGHPGSPG